MRKRVVSLLIAVVLLLALVIPVIAITDGELDGDGHPYVGLMVAQDSEGNPLWRCSGTLLSPKLFLTAGHCTEPPTVSATIWFDEDVQSLVCSQNDPRPDCYPYGGPTTVTGVTYTHPQYNPLAFFLYDLGVVVLKGKGYETSEYGALPVLNVLDQMAKERGLQDVTFTAVGYGLQESFSLAAQWKENNERVRMVAYPHLIQINTPGFTGDFSILLSNNHSTGGTCFGDSGGPNFIGDTNVVGGVTSFGMNGNCAGTGGVYRVDKADDLDWLYGEFGKLLGKGKKK